MNGLGIPYLPWIVGHTVQILIRCSVLQCVPYILQFSGADPGGFLRGFDLIIIPYLLCVFRQTGLSKQCSPRSDAAERGVWSGSTLIATHPAILHTLTGTKMALLKRRIRKCVPNLANFYPKFSMKMKFWVKEGFDWILRPTSDSAPCFSTNQLVIWS